MRVPIAIVKYNEKMGGVDAVDQVRTAKNGIEMHGRARKWNVRFYEMMFGLALTNCWNIYRHFRSNKLDHFDFRDKIFEYLYENRIDAPKMQTRENAVEVDEEHQLLKFPRTGNGPNSRKKQLSCVACPNSIRKVDDEGMICEKRNSRLVTTYCSVCLQPFHTSCFFREHLGGKVPPYAPDFYVQKVLSSANEEEK